MIREIAGVMPSARPGTVSAAILHRNLNIRKAGYLLDVTDGSPAACRCRDRSARRRNRSQHLHPTGDPQDPLDSLRRRGCSVVSSAAPRDGRERRGRQRASRRSTAGLSSADRRRHANGWRVRIGQCGRPIRRINGNGSWRTRLRRKTGSRLLGSSTTSCPGLCRTWPCWRVVAPDAAGRTHRRQTGGDATRMTLISTVWPGRRPCVRSTRPRQTA